MRGRNAGMARTCAVRRHPRLRGWARSPARSRRAARPWRPHRDPGWTRSARPTLAARDQGQQCGKRISKIWAAFVSCHSSAPEASRKALKHRAQKRIPGPELPVAHLIREACQPIADIGEVELGPLLDQIGDARVVLLGEATPWHVGVLSNEDSHHDRARDAARLQHRCYRRGLARRSTRSITMFAGWTSLLAKIHRSPVSRLGCGGTERFSS